jgi:hypothetical protein
MANGKNIRQKKNIYVKFSNNRRSNIPRLKARLLCTRCVRGENNDNILAHNGRFERGKNVSLKRNIGVMNKNTGKLKDSIFGIIPVKNIPIDPKEIPPINASGISRNPEGKFISPNKLSIIIMIMVAIRDFVAPQMISPVIISSSERGVAIIESKVF